MQKYKIQIKLAVTTRNMKEKQAAINRPIQGNTAIIHKKYDQQKKKKNNEKQMFFKKKYVLLMRLIM